MIDYLQRYLTPEGIDIPRMLNDDFFLAIKLTFNAGYYISAMKLLVSFIDTMAYLESGDGGGRSFKRWLDDYVDLANLGISSEEVWEHRNSLLHMSTLNSRNVAAGKVRRLVAYVGILPLGMPSEDKDAKLFSLQSLIVATAEGIQRYIGILNKDRNRFPEFIKRYDHVLSDTRIERLGPEGNDLA